MKFPPPFEVRRTELNILPMVNVVFLLLIFFMLVGGIAPSDRLGVSPPISRTGEPESGQWVRIAVAADGRMLLAGNSVDTTMLAIVVAQFIKQDPDTRFQLKADAALGANSLIQIMEVLRQTGVRRLSLLIEHERFSAG